MKYIRLNKKGEVVEIFAYDPFEWIPNEEFLSDCRQLKDSVEVEYGWVEQPGGTYSPPELDLETIDLALAKEQAITQTKDWLKRELDIPMQWIDGKYYSITEEKQRFLNARLTVGLLKMTLEGKDPNDIYLAWNESGEEHEPWGYLKLCALAEAIDKYIEQFVIKQQAAEKQINEANTYEEVKTIVQKLRFEGDEGLGEDSGENAETEDEDWEDSVGDD